jgi:NAD(P)H-hydrate epimerase
MKLVTGRQMAAIDRRAIASGVSGFDLMENAGRGVFEAVVERLRQGSGRKVAVVCGKGNNGGDGFVVARLLRAAQVPVQTFLLARPEEVAGDAGAHLERTRSSGVEVEEVAREEGVERLVRGLEASDLVVDAILGTGLRGGARGLAAQAIEAIHRAGRPVVSVDVPSGLDADTGRAEGPCVQAALTVTFGLPRIGHFFFPGRALCGALRLVDIGIPRAAVEAEGVEVHLTTGADARRWLPRRRPDAHKGDCGRVVVLAGSVGLTGAATLCASAAVRAGAGLVTVGAPASLNDILEVKLTEAMTVPLPEVRRRRCLSLRARGEVRRLAERADAVALGPGIGTHRETAELVHRLLADIPAPLVLDADGLNALEGRPELLRSRHEPTIITPHPGEFSRLTGRPTPDLLADPIGCARAFAVSHGVVVALKGAPTVVADPSGAVFVNPTGNAGMATGGAGDVLTGVIAALVGQGLGPEAAARLGVFLHGAAGDLARDRRGEVGLAAGDLVEALPEAVKRAGEGALRNPYFEGA